LHEQLELVPTRPNFSKLYAVLKSFRLSVQNPEKNTGVSLSEIEAQIFCSPSELIRALAELGAVEFEPGRWGLLSPAAEGEMLEDLLTTARAEGWPISALPLSDSRGRLAGTYPPTLLNHCLSLYFGGSDGVRALNQAKYAALIAYRLLLQRPTMALDDFLKQWQESFRDDITPSLSSLAGLAVVEQGRIRWFPAAELPVTAQARFKALFEVKKTWRFDEIAPFLRDIVPPSGKVEQLLIQWTVVASTPAGAVYHAREF